MALERVGHFSPRILASKRSTSSFPRETLNRVSGICFLCESGTTPTLTSAASACNTHTIGWSHIIPTDGLRETFDGIAKHCARHLIRMCVEETLKDGDVAFADFPQHPSDCLVHQVLVVVQKRDRKAKGVFEVVPADEEEG